MNDNEPIPEERISMETNQNARNIFETMPDPKPAGPPYVKDGDIIDLTQVKSVEERTFTFDDRTVVRKIYKYHNGTELVVPISLNAEIIAVSKANAGKIKAIQVKTEGTGKLKKYRAIPKL
jgi:ribosomal protein L21